MEIAVSTWFDVWVSRKLDHSKSSTLARLMAADGHDSGFCEGENEEIWRNYVRHTCAMLGIFPGASVYEVGCGSGAYLYEMHQMGCPVGGLDYSQAQLGNARSVMPDGNWEYGFANALDTDQKYDFVVSCGTFIYFPSLEYAQQVLARMVAKARLGISVIEVSDLARKEEAIALRKKAIGEGEYARKYGNLHHLYIDKNWITEELARLGCTSTLMEDKTSDTLHSQYRYTVYAWKSNREAGTTSRAVPEKQNK